MTTPTLFDPSPSTLPISEDRPELVHPAAPRARRVSVGWLLRWVPAAREVLLLLGLYLGYTLSRLLADGNLEVAERHARQVLHLESFFGLDVERALNTAVARVEWLEVGSAYWYALLHYLVTPLVLVLLWRRGPAVYKPARRALVLATSTALIGYLIYPTAPPRLMGGYVDVLNATSTWGWWGADASAPRGLGGATNELAAMPSMHVGWALWVSIMLASLARRHWQRVLAFCYAGGTALIVVVTGNHWLLDGIVGGAIMAGALATTGVVPWPARLLAFRPCMETGLRKCT